MQELNLRAMTGLLVCRQGRHSQPCLESTFIATYTALLPYLIRQMIF
jgi:hypothetical protein